MRYEDLDHLILEFPEEVEAALLADPDTSLFLRDALRHLHALPPKQAARECFLLPQLTTSKLRQRPRC